MKMQVHNSLLRTTLIIASALVIVSCQPTATPTQDTQDNDIQDIRVQIAEPVKSTTKVEQFPLPNCGGTDKLEQSLGTYASASKSATVGTKASITGGGEAAVSPIVKLKLEIQVEVAYQQTFESTNSRLDSIKMSAAAGTHVVYTIVWEEQTFSSIVQYSADGKVHEVPYTYKLSVPKIDKSYNVECPGVDLDIPTPTALSELPAVTQQPISEPNDLYDGWVICWHGRDGYEYLIAYPEDKVRQGLSLNFNLTNAQGRQVELANDSLKMCLASGEWYGHPDPNPWFPTVSYLKLLDGQILVCSDSPGCKGNQWAMLPESHRPANSPALQAPNGTDIHVITYSPSP
jgi:hypothetical protein